MLDHIAFNVKNISKAVSWYKKFLKAEVEYQDETWAMLKIDGAKIALTLESQHPPHAAIRIQNSKHFDNLFPDIEVKEHRDGSRYIYISDLDGNNIEYIFYGKDEV
tara:strand:- start:5530 stop:5847 length:318 start_codon:yes stop_codon:yes gene_type:complete